MTQKIEARCFSQAYFTDRASTRGRYVEKMVCTTEPKFKLC